MIYYAGFRDECQHPTTFRKTIMVCSFAPGHLKIFENDEKSKKNKKKCISV